MFSQHRKLIIFSIICIFLVITSVYFVTDHYFFGNDNEEEQDSLSFDKFRDLKQKIFQEQASLETSGKKVFYQWDDISGGFKKIALEDLNGFKEISKQKSIDLDQDGIEEEVFIDRGQVSTYKDSKVLWQTTDDIWVDDFYLSDSTHDGEINLNLSVWRSGNFGSSKPFWVDENDMSIRNHFFVYKWEGNIMKPVWHSSNLANPNCAFLFVDIDSDGDQELIVIEGEYQENYKCKGKYLAVWEWNEWGFFNEWRSEVGTYFSLEAYSREEDVIIKTLEDI